MEIGIALGRHRRAPSRRVATCTAVMSLFIWSPLLILRQVVACVSLAGGLSQCLFITDVPCLLKVSHSFSLPTAIQSALGAAARISCCWLLFGPGAQLHSALLLASVQCRDNIRTHGSQALPQCGHSRGQVCSSEEERACREDARGLGRG